MSLIFSLLLIAVLHFVFFVCYPETGPNGNYFLCISMLLWSGFIIFLVGSLKFIKLISGFLRLVFHLAVFSLIFLVIALTMPQRDKTSVFKKLRNKQFPTRESLDTGFIRLGFKFNTRVNADIKILDSKINNALKKLKND